MPWVLDGNNLARGGSREAVRAAALELARSERVRLVVFFDGAPPPGAPDRERLGSVEVRYTANADTAILAFLSPSGRGWRLATDDRSLALRARDSGAEVVDAAGFWRKVTALTERAGGVRPSASTDVAGHAVFSEATPLPEAPVRIARRRPRRR